MFKFKTERDPEFLSTILERTWKKLKNLELRGVYYKNIFATPINYN